VHLVKSCMSFVMCVFCFCVYICGNVSHFTVFRKYRNKTGSLLYLASFVTYMSGFLLWNIDNMYCHHLRYDTLCVCVCMFVCVCVYVCVRE
jgi:hypothetical protein